MNVLCSQMRMSFIHCEICTKDGRERLSNDSNDNNHIEIHTQFPTIYQTRMRGIDRDEYHLNSTD